MFWPREIWGRYAQQLADFKEGEHAVAAVAALNDMVRCARCAAPGRLHGA